MSKFEEATHEHIRKMKVRLVTKRHWGELRIEALYGVDDFLRKFQIRDNSQMVDLALEILRQYKAITEQEEQERERKNAKARQRRRERKAAKAKA